MLIKKSQSIIEPFMLIVIAAHLPKNIYNGANVAQLRFKKYYAFCFDLISEIKIHL